MQRNALKLDDKEAKQYAFQQTSIRVSDLHEPISIYICGDTEVHRLGPDKRAIPIREELFHTLTNNKEFIADKDSKQQHSRQLIDCNLHGYLARHYQLKAGPLKLGKLALDKKKAFEYVTENLGIKVQSKRNLFIVLYRDVEKGAPDGIENAAGIAGALNAAGVPDEHIVYYQVKYDFVKYNKEYKCELGTPNNISSQEILLTIREPLQNIINHNPVESDPNGATIDTQRERRNIIGEIINFIDKGLEEYEKRKRAGLILITDYNFTEANIKDLPANTPNAVYVRVSHDETNKLFYVNKKTKTCVDITPLIMPGIILPRFDKELKPSQQLRLLSLEGLQFIQDQIGHTYHPDLNKLKRRMTSIDAVHKALIKAKNDIESDKLKDNNYGNVLIVLRNLHACLRDQRAGINMDSCLGMFRDISFLGEIYKKAIDKIDDAIEKLEKQIKNNALKK